MYLDGYISCCIRVPLADARKRLLLIISTNTEFGNLLIFLLKFRKIISRTIFSTLPVYIFAKAVTPASCTLCIWLPLILILLSNDVHLNPGPHFQNNFMPWNVNSPAKDNFQRVSLIEAHNSVFNYDLVSIYETSLNDSVEFHEPLLRGNYPK